MGWFDVACLVVAPVAIVIGIVQPNWWLVAAWVFIGVGAVLRLRSRPQRDALAAKARTQRAERPERTSRRQPKRATPGLQSPRANGQGGPASGNGGPSA
jgi:hypothetical protein